MSFPAALPRPGQDVKLPSRWPRGVNRGLHSRVEKQSSRRVHTPEKVGATPTPATPRTRHAVKPRKGAETAFPLRNLHRVNIVI